MPLSLPLLSIVACLLFASLLARTPWFGFLQERGSRVGSLDGLRGFLALAVFFHHFAITHQWKQTGRWTAPPEVEFENFGKVGVALFFMITGYLFTAKIMGKAPVNWSRLYRSRVYRIVPLYLLAFLSIALIVACNTGFQLQVSASRLLLDLGRWGLFHGATINGFADTRTIIAGVDWTLRHEWAFYLALPAIQWVIHQGRGPVLALATLTAALYLHPVKLLSLGSEHLVYFVIGGIPAAVASRGLVPRFVSSRPVSALILVLAALALHQEQRGLLQLVLISGVFFGVALGNDVFGLLTTRPAVLLGEISYSIYLLHGLVLYLIFTQFGVVEPARFTASAFSWLMPVVALLVTATSAATYLLVEKRFIDLGHATANQR